MRLIFLGIFCGLFICCRAQFNQWTWMHGSNTPNQPAVYGTQTIPTPANTPSARYECAQWKDLQGNFWLFGGGLAGTRYCDLWKYDPATNMWTWMHGSQLTNQPAVYGVQGIPAPTNTPGAVGFGACTWTDLNGNLWLFGGDDGANAPFDNLWKYDPAINMWTWMKGTGTPGPPAVYGTQGIAAIANTPGGREETSCTWTDLSGNLWLFGGTPSGVGASLNDLWKYDPLTNMWTWMKGANFPNQSGIYGTLGIANAANTPGGRWCYTSWTDLQGNLWLFGGIDAFSPVFMGFFNDLWKYDPLTNMWTWMSGNNTVNQPGIYGTKCVPSAANIPGGRGETRSCWKDDCDNLWLLGGRDLNFSMYNDLWRYEIATGQWTWVSGDNTPNQSGVYGTITIPSPANKPGCRMGAVSWTNASGLWLFGGNELFGGEYNDLWLYRPDTISVSITAQPFSGCAPLTVNFNSVAQSSCSAVKDYNWNFNDPSSGSADTSSLPAPSHVFNSAGTYTVTLVARDCSGNPDSSQTIITVTPGITLNSTATASGCFSDGSVNVIATGGSGTYSYSWQPAIGTASSAFGLIPGSYTVVVTDNANCSATDTLTVLLDQTGFNVDLGNDTVFCGTISLVADAGNAGANYSWSTSDTTESISIVSQGIYWVQVSTGICAATDSIMIAAVSPPDLNPSYSFCDQPVIILDAGYQPHATYLWSTGDTVSSINVTAEGTYYVTISNGSCMLTDSVIIEESHGGSLWLPNSFTPDGNDLNEIFIPVGEGVTDFHMKIFNRWGQLLYETSDINQGWDGTYKSNPVQEDVYVWVIDYFSNCAGKGQVHRIGHVSVIR
jgi:gliding motility-associated-like protein